MKVLAYAVRDDEVEYIEKYSKMYGFTCDILKEDFGPHNAVKAKGYDAVSIMFTCDCSKEAVDTLYSLGVKCIVNRGNGYDKIDTRRCKELGISVSNVPKYSPTAISELAVLLTLMVLRNAKRVIRQEDKGNFSIKGLIGREIRNCKVGVIGVGSIGKKVYDSFKGLGASVVGYDLNSSDVSLEELLKNCDVVTLHLPLNESTRHILNTEKLSLMKPTSILINTSRGGLVDSKAVLRALELGKISGYGMDVYEFETGILHEDLSGRDISDEVFNALLKRDDVVITPHIAFYTDQAVSDMVETAFKNLNAYFNTGNVIDDILR